MRSQLIIAHGDRLLGHRQCDRSNKVFYPDYINEKFMLCNSQLIAQS